jgi:hypothetical protein
MHALAHVRFVKLVHVFLKWLKGTSNTNPNQVSNLHLCEVLARNSKFNSISDGALPRSASVSSPSVDDSGHDGRAGAYHLVSLRHHSCPPGRSWPLRCVSGRFFRHVANPCFKCFSCFQMYVSCGCCKSRLGCCNSSTCMLQASIPNVSSFFCTRML